MLLLLDLLIVAAVVVAFLWLAFAMHWAVGAIMLVALAVGFWSETTWWQPKKRSLGL